MLRHIAFSRSSKLHLVSADAVVLQGGGGTAEDHQNRDHDHGLAETFTFAAPDAPLHEHAVQTDQAVRFSGNEEDEGVEQAVMIGMHAGKVGADAGRIGQHGDHVREDADQQHDGGHDLDSPEGGVGVVDQADMVLHVAALMIAAREAAQSAETVDADEERDQTDKDHVSPFMGMAADKGEAGGRHQVPEQILGDLDGARECHVAEKENGQQTAGHRLGDIAPAVHLERRGMSLSLMAPLMFSSSVGVWARRILSGSCMEQVSKIAVCRRLLTGVSIFSSRPYYFCLMAYIVLSATGSEFNLYQ